MDELSYTVATDEPVDQTPETTAEAPQTQETPQTGDPEAETVELTEEEQEAAERDKQAKSRQSAFDKRIKEIDWKRHEAERRAAENERVANELRAKYEGKTSAVVDQPPQIEQFESLQDYEKAIQDFAIKQAQTSLKQEYERKQQEQEFAAVGAKFAQAEAEYVKSNPDYVNVLTSMEPFIGPEGLPQHLRDVILRADEAPALLYELGKDLAGFADFLGLPPNEQLMHLGAVRASLKTNGDSTPSPRTPAAAALPKPISTVTGRTTVKKDPYSLSDKEFLASKGLS